MGVFAILGGYGFITGYLNEVGIQPNEGAGLQGSGGGSPGETGSGSESGSVAGLAEAIEATSTAVTSARNSVTAAQSVTLEEIPGSSINGISGSSGGGSGSSSIYKILFAIAGNIENEITEVENFLKISNSYLGIYLGNAELNKNHNKLLSLDNELLEIRNDIDSWINSGKNTAPDSNKKREEFRNLREEEAGVYEDNIMSRILEDYPDGFEEISLSNAIENPQINENCKYDIGNAFNNKIVYTRNLGAVGEEVESKDQFYYLNYPCGIEKKDVKITSASALEGSGNSAGKESYEVKDIYSGENLADIEVTKLPEFSKSSLSIVFDQRKGDEISLSPDCYNLVQDEGEEGIDTEGDCESKERQVDEKRFPYLYWVLFLLFLGALFYTETFGILKIKSSLFQGKRAINRKDFRKAIENYYKISKIYGGLNWEQKDLCRQDCLDYYLFLERKLGNVKVVVKRGFLTSQMLPNLNYDDSKIGLNKIKDRDFDRIKKLIEEGLKSRRDIIVSLYNGLDESDKKKIRKRYLNYVKKAGRKD